MTDSVSELPHAEDSRELRDVVFRYILAVPLAAMEDDGTKKHAALDALNSLAKLARISEGVR